MDPVDLSDSSYAGDFPVDGNTPQPQMTRRPQQGLVALFAGLAIASGLFFARPHLFGPDDTVTRYLNDPLEYVLLTMFFVGLSHVVMRVLIGRTRLAELSRIEQPLRTAEPSEWRLVRVTDRVVRDRLVSLADLRDRWTGGSVVEYAKLFSTRAADEVAGGYAVLHTILWAIPIVGFLGTVLGITSAIASITPEQLEGSLVEVTGNLAFAFDTTGLSLGFSLVLGFALLVARRQEDRSLSRLDNLTESWLLPHFPDRETSDGFDGGALTQALATWSEEMSRQQRQLASTLQQIAAETSASFHNEAAALRNRSMQQQADDWSATTLAVSESVRTWGEQIDAVLSEAGDRFAGGLRVVTSETNDTLAIAGQQQQHWATLLEHTQQLELLQQSIDSQLARSEFAEQLDQTLHQLTAAVHMLTSRAKAA